MIDYFNPPNSIWPNGMKDDPDGHAVFYPLGTNKVDISTVTWPEGDKLISPFVYQNDELVGFVDTKAITVSGTATTTMNYSHIEADFASIFEGKLTVNAPNATVKKFSWGGLYDFVIIDFTATDQETIDTVRTAKRVVDNELYDADNNLIGTIDTSKIKVGGIFEFEDLKLDGLFCNLSLLTGEERGINLSEFNSDLSSLRDGSMMFGNCSNLATFSVNLPSLTKGIYMFSSCTNLTTFSSNLSGLTIGDSMFSGCSNLTSFSSDLSSLTNGTQMFENCTNLASFSSNLSSLTVGGGMFDGCTNLTTFSSNLPSLTNGAQMFENCTALTSVSSDLSSLTNGETMFEDCTALASFNGDLSSLTNGKNMFRRCSNLTAFSSNLSSLTEGYWMFEDCKLDAPSVKNIVDTIASKSYLSWLHIGMGCDNTTEDKDRFAQEIGYADMDSLSAVLKDKGWTLTAQYTGRPSTTYSLRRPSENTLPVFVKLVETEDHADYASIDGSKKYRLSWFHETTGSTDGYTQFNTLEEAIETLNIKPIERN